MNAKGLYPAAKISEMHPGQRDVDALDTLLVPLLTEASFLTRPHWLVSASQTMEWRNKVRSVREASGFGRSGIGK